MPREGGDAAKRSRTSGRNKLNPAQLKREILALGFSRVGFASVEPVADHDRYRDWIAAGNAAGMDYLVKHSELRRSPADLLPGARSVIMVSLNYHVDDPGSLQSHEAGHGWVSRYAWGRDYHKVMRRRLKDLARLLTQSYESRATRACVDTAPLLERSLAAASGLGWIGRNSMLIDEKIGSYTFLGAVLTDLDLPADGPAVDRCGSCTACIDACPTDALSEPGMLDSRRCISYLTIEHKGEIDPALADLMGNHLFGCDICQEVCPWNSKAPATNEADFEPRPGCRNPELTPLVDMDRSVLLDKFAGTPLMRAGSRGLSRNARIALRNQNGRS